METKLAYLNDSYLFESTTTVTKIVQAPDSATDMQLDETIFYPQGGGQPADNGTIETDASKFSVEDVRFLEGTVHHYGRILHGSISIGDRVKLIVDARRRILNMCNHTAGHLVASVIAELRPGLKVDKGYHFPSGPYVQFEGTISQEERQALASKIQERANQMIVENREVITGFVPYEELERVCRHVPENIPKDKPLRIVTIEGCISIPDGGTQTRNLSEIGSIIITKIKTKGENTIVSYTISSKI